MPGEGPEAGGALAEAAGESPTHWGETPTPALLSPTTLGPAQSGTGGDSTLPPKSCPHSPAPTKLRTQRDRLLGHRSNSSCTQDSPRDLVPLV